MKFTLNWLKEFVDFGGTAAELSKLLTSAGLEVESLTRRAFMFSIWGRFSAAIRPVGMKSACASAG